MVASHDEAAGAGSEGGVWRAVLIAGEQYWSLAPVPGLGKGTSAVPGNSREAELVHFSVPILA